MSEKRGCACGIHLNGKIYIFGGTVDAFSRQAKRSCEVYDIWNNQWYPLPAMRIPRFHAGAVLMRDCVYVMGGIGTDNMNNELNKVVECYSIEKNKWMTEHKIPYEETYLRSCSVRLYKGLIRTRNKLVAKVSES
jgi:N-acetylneuraminic acid mutarotase